MSQQGYVAAPPYSQAQPRLGGYQAGFGPGPTQPLNGHYGGPPQAFAAPPTGRKLPGVLHEPDLLAPACSEKSFSRLKPVICHFLRIKIVFFLTLLFGCQQK